MTQHKQKTIDAARGSLPQTKRESLREAWDNTIIAFCVSVLAHMYVVYPYIISQFNGGYFDELGASDGIIAGVVVTFFYTVISVCRNYTVRRWHETKKKGIIITVLTGIKESTLFCVNAVRLFLRNR